MDSAAVHHRTRPLLGHISALSASDQARAVICHYSIVLVVCFLEVFTVFTVQSCETVDINDVGAGGLFR